MILSYFIHFVITVDVVLSGHGILIRNNLDAFTAIKLS